MPEARSCRIDRESAMIAWSFVRELGVATAVLMTGDRQAGESKANVGAAGARILHWRSASVLPS